MKRIKKEWNKLLVILLVLTMAFAMSACKKNGDPSSAESSLSIDTQTETEEMTNEISETEETFTESETVPETGGILEEDGEIVIEVPDDEDTYGE